MFLEFRRTTMLPALGSVLDLLDAPLHGAMVLEEARQLVMRVQKEANVR